MYQATSPRLIVDKGGRPSIASRLIKDDPTRERIASGYTSVPGHGRMAMMRDRGGGRTRLRQSLVEPVKSSSHSLTFRLQQDFFPFNILDARFLISSRRAIGTRFQNQIRAGLEIDQGIVSISGRKIGLTLVCGGCVLRPARANTCVPCANAWLIVHAEHGCCVYVVRAFASRTL